MPTPACYKGKVSLISRWEESSMLICNGYAHAHSHNSGTTLHYRCCAMITVVTAGRWLHSLWLVSLCINVQFSLCCVCRYRLSLCVWLRFVISVAVFRFLALYIFGHWKLPPASCTLGALALHTSSCLWHFFCRQQRFALFTKVSVTLCAVLLVLTIPVCMCIVRFKVLLQAAHFFLQLFSSNPVSSDKNLLTLCPQINFKSFFLWRFDSHHLCCCKILRLDLFQYLCL